LHAETGGRDIPAIPRGDIDVLSEQPRPKLLTGLGSRLFSLCSERYINSAAAQDDAEDESLRPSANRSGPAAAGFPSRLGKQPLSSQHAVLINEEMATEAAP
jgi:hypothetical protein